MKKITLILTLVCVLGLVGCERSMDVEIRDSYMHYSVGDEVVVYYDGNIVAGDPARVDTVYALTLRTPANRETE